VRPRKYYVLADTFPSGSSYKWLEATSPSLLLIPLELGQPWMVEFIVKQQPHLLDVDLATRFGSPLIFAIASRPDFLSVLLKLGVNLNKPSSIKPRVYGQSHIPNSSYAPISWAAAIRSEVALDLLLSQVNLPDNIMHMAISCMVSSTEMIHNLLPRHTGVNFTSFSAHALVPYIHLHSESRVLPVINALRQRGADVNFTVGGASPIHTLLCRFIDDWLDSMHLPLVKALVEPSGCDLSVQDWTARTALHIALDYRLERIITYLLEKNARLSATATLRPAPDMWSWAIHEMWFPKIQAAALAADQPCTRIKGKVIEANRTSQVIEFPGALTADHEDPNQICAVVVSAIVKKASEY
ncbi:hypothetical protein DFH29DRAFT_1034719, partial [Suillus ampliporus]